MGEGYSTGDDVVYEMLGFALLATILACDPNYVNMIPFPRWSTPIITFAVIMIIPLLSRGRIFWAVLGGIAWILLKSGLVKEDKTEYSGYYDEEGKFHLIEKKPDEVSQDNQGRRST